MRTKQWTFVGALAAAVALTAPMSPATAAPTASCTSDSIFLSGAKAYYEECTDDYMRTRVKGWVEDTDADGKCAYLSVYMDNGYTNQWKACPKGTRTPVDTGYQNAFHAEVRLGMW
ncbi:hypothetical protein [Streptomyces griseus]|uniref:hypothetical protein n=1 Tax=Streptomyces griseus TaxID=1911 RepID=UPI00084062F4|nr:hypothetical protein [Streptomyces griseus]